METRKKLFYKVVQKGRISHDIKRASEKIREQCGTESLDYALLKLIEDLSRVEEDHLDFEFVSSCVEDIHANIAEITPCEGLLGGEFNITLTRDSEGFFAECIELPGCFSEGRTEEEALENIKEAIQVHLECMAKYDIEPRIGKQVFKVNL